MEKKKQIDLKWAKSETKGSYNFGDDLNPYLIDKLTGQNVRYFHFAYTRLNSLKLFLKKFKVSNEKWLFFQSFINSLFVREYIIAIGSILQWYGSKRCVVWGAGILNSGDMVKESQFLAVRGEYTKKRLEDLGYNTKGLVLGDPALLLPLVYKKPKDIKYELGIIPHIDHYDHFNQIKDTDVLVINLNQENPEKVVDEIRSCKCIASTSLHGLIVAHAYDIPALWYTASELKLAGDNVKFKDYFSSVGIPNYEPFLFFDVKKERKKIHTSIKENANLNGIKTDVREIQRSLLQVAPFEVKANFIESLVPKVS